MGNGRVNIGKEVYDFTLKDQNGKEFKLTDFAGKTVLISFHPLAWTEVCAMQMKALEENKETFDSLNTVAVGVSVDTVPSKRAWAENLQIENTRLLSDFWPHGGIAELYGIFREEEGFSERANVVVDENEKVVFFKLYDMDKAPDLDEIIDFLKQRKKA
ncbi:redoxin domain-containing protein [candidate division TA06 bacterium]|uniref:Redoxin domain-containing protein n=1 Tax=candidate division TA06 bacterium TaxID=2250710 RepID=A0A523UUL8_UNCT6|nr:MAG: redoxin domain-containing protein [candidate division TA06 bacterium]